MLAKPLVPVVISFAAGTRYCIKQSSFSVSTVSTFCFFSGILNGVRIYVLFKVNTGRESFFRRWSAMSVFQNMPGAIIYQVPTRISSRSIILTPAPAPVMLDRLDAIDIVALDAAVSFGPMGERARR